MQIVFHNHVSIDLQALVFLQKSPGVEYYLGEGWACENGEPVDDCARQKMELVLFIDSVAASWNLDSLL